MKKETGGCSPGGTRLFALVGWWVLVVSSFAVMAQTRLPDALVHGRRVYIYHEEGISLDVVDRFAREVVTGGRFELVSAREQADLDFGLDTWSSESTLVLPSDGLHVPVTPNERPGHVSPGRVQLVSEVTHYQFTVYDLATETMEWHDTRGVAWTHKGAVARLAKDLNKRLVEEDARRARSEPVR